MTNRTAKHRRYSTADRPGRDREAEGCDSLGEVEVAGGPVRGAQTQRSLEHFKHRTTGCRRRVYHAYGDVKKAAANVENGGRRRRPGKGEMIEGCATR